MPLLDLQKSLRLLGKIRLGEQKTSANGKSYPSKLSNWRFTSPSVELLEHAADVYGGSVRIWEGAPTEGVQYELYATTDRLQVVVPPDNALIQDYEMWSAGGCVRRCSGTGQTEQLSGNPCLCPVDAEERAALASKGKACKMTTRLKVLLPDIPDLGVWMCESHGYYAAVELAGFEEVMALATQRKTMIPAQLRIDQRTVKRKGETRHYAVPVLELVTVTAHQLARGEVAALGQSAPALGAGSAGARALDAPRVPPRTDAPEARRSNGDGGPPMPPLPHEDAGPAPMGPVGGGVSGSSPARDADTPPPSTVNRVAIAAREAGLDDDGRHDLAEWASESRVRSSALLDQEEQAFAIDAARKIKAGSHHLARGDDGALKLLDVKFGFAADREGGVAAEALTPSAIGAMKGPDLVAALKERGLDCSGTLPQLRSRLIEAITSEPF